MWRSTGSWSRRSEKLKRLGRRRSASSSTGFLRFVRRSMTSLPSNYKRTELPQRVSTPCNNIA